MNYEPNDSFYSLISQVKYLSEKADEIDSENNSALETVQSEAKSLVSEVLNFHEEDLKNKLSFYITLTNSGLEEDEFPYQAWLYVEKTESYNDWQIDTGWFDNMIDNMNDTSLMLRNIHDLLNNTYESSNQQWQMLWLYQNVMKKLTDTKNHDAHQIEMFLDILHHTDKTSEYLYSMDNEENQKIKEEKFFNEIKWTRWSGMQLLSALNNNDETLIRKNFSLLKSASIEEQIGFFDSWVVWGKSPFAMRWERSSFKGKPDQIAGFEWERLNEIVKYDFDNKSDFTNIIANVISATIENRKLHQQRISKTSSEKIDNVSKLKELRNFRNYLELNEKIENAHGHDDNEKLPEKTLKI
jgi:hypothetical protein